MIAKKQAAFHRNERTGMAVFSGPKGHILMALDIKKGQWGEVGFTEDDAFASSYLEW